MSKSKIFSNNLNDRHMAITDGVFAIAMTILVLEIAVPTIADIQSGVALSEYFVSYLAPSILIYFISFYLVYTFWETTAILFNFKKIKHSILILNMFTMATVCLIPFATGFLFKFYAYRDVNIFFSLLILTISLLYLLMFLLLVRENFGQYFKRKEEIKSSIQETYESYEDGIELDNVHLYMRGVALTVFYLLLFPIFTSILSLVLAFVSPIVSVLSFLLTSVLRFILIRRRERTDNITDIRLTDDEKEFIENVKENLYGE